MTRNVYTFLLYLLLPFTPLKLLWRAKNQPEYLQHWRERYGFYTAPSSNKPVIWLHCVSVGETRAASPLVKALLQQYPNHQILLTHTTPTGRDASEQLFGDSVTRVYLPYDVPFAVNRFLAHFKPVIGVLMETELWFNVIASCKQRRIPVLLVNARLSERSARGYTKLGNLTREGLQSLAAVAAQTAQDAGRLQALGAGNVSVMGNLKFDVEPPQDAAANGEKLRADLGAEHRPVFLAASTRADNGENEESMILEAIAKANIPNLLTIIVPRHPQRFDEVENIIRKCGLIYLRRSDLGRSNLATPADQDIQVILGDSMGEMFTYYAACDVSFVGGSLLPLGGQNLIEACAMGKPVLIGPHTFNFASVCHDAVENGIALRVYNSTELASTLKNLLEDFNLRIEMSAAALRFGQQETGATLNAATLIAKFLA
jgi:3-deoxy-D-manno-octulosonic-acid transferase